MSRNTLPHALGYFLGKVRQWPSFLWRLEARFKGVLLEGSCTFLGRPLISVATNSRLVLGDGVTIASAVRCSMLACFQPSVLRTLVPGSQLVLGSQVALSGTVLCAGASIEVGEGTIFGSGAMVIDNDFHLPKGEWGWTMDSSLCREMARPVKIGRGVFIGARAIVLKGVTIGDRAIVGAGAVVTRDVPARRIAAGNPAQILESKKSLA